MSNKKSRNELVAELLYSARANEAANDAFDEVACQKLGINRTDLRALNVIENQGPMPAGKLAEQTGLTSAAVTAVLDRLERAGYARRVRDEKDRRQVIVEVMPLLHERGAQIWGPIAEDAGKDFDRMSVAELKTVIDFFRIGRELNERHVERIKQLEFD